MDLANHEATRLKYDSVCTEHVLLAFAKTDSGFSAQVLQNLGVDLITIQNEIEKYMRPGANVSGMHRLPNSPRVEKVIGYSVDQAREMNHQCVSTGHFLLGLVCERKGIAGQWLRNLGVNDDTVRRELQKLLGKDFSPVKLLTGSLSHEARFGRFTTQAMTVMELAEAEARFLKQEFLGTEHILLGLMKEESGLAAKVLGKLIDFKKIRAEVEKLVTVGTDAVPPEELPHMPRVKQMVQYALEEARNLGHRFVGTDHLLLGLLREEVASVILVNAGLNLEDLRHAVLNGL